jgi:hypothetical protein
MTSVIDDLIARYKAKPVKSESEITDEEIVTLMKAARIAPSADNSQIWRFLIIRDKRKIEEVLKISRISGRIYKVLIISLAAPFFIRHTRREQPFYAMDVPIAITHIYLQGLELNIDVDIHFVFEEDEVKKMLNLPDGLKSVAILGLNKYED